MSDFDEVIRTRRSVGKVRDDAIDRSTILELIELATSAPNHHLHQPWRFMVVQAEDGGDLAMPTRQPSCAPTRTPPRKSLRVRLHGSCVRPW